MKDCELKEIELYQLTLNDLQNRFGPRNMILERTFLFSVSEHIVMIIALHLLLTFFRKIHFLTGKK